MQIQNYQTHNVMIPRGHEEIFARLSDLYRELFRHNGYGALRVEMRFLKKGQKEIFVISGKEFRFVVDYPGAGASEGESVSLRCPGAPCEIIPGREAENAEGR